MKTDTENMSLKERATYRTTLIKNLEQKLKMELDYFSHFNYHPLHVKSSAAVDKVSDKDSEMNRLESDSFVELQCVDDDVSVRSEITMDHSVLNLKQFQFGDNACDITHEMETYAARISGNCDRSTKSDRTSYTQDDESAVDVLSKRSYSQNNVGNQNRGKECTKKRRFQHKQHFNLDKTLLAKGGKRSQEQYQKPVSVLKRSNNKHKSKEINSTLKNRNMEKTTTAINTTRHTRQSTGSSNLPQSIVQWSSDLNKMKPSSARFGLDYNPTSTMSEEEQILRKVVVGIPIFPRQTPLSEAAVRNYFSLNKSPSDVALVQSMESLMNDVFQFFKVLMPEDVDFADISELTNRYHVNQKSFSILAPCREPTTLKVSHGSHRFKYQQYDDSTRHIVHRVFLSQITIPENCMVIMDENLIHAGTESMTCGYAPAHSPRYFSYLKPKNCKVHKDSTYNKFDLCDKGCEFCRNSGVINIVEKLKESFSILNSNVLSLATKNYTTDWVAGDIRVLGWVVVRNGVTIDQDFENHLAHEFQTILCTNKMLRYTAKGTWFAINSHKEIIGSLIPGTLRKYFFSDDAKPNKNAGIEWGKRKMIPVLDGKMDPNKGCSLTWFTQHGCSFIAKFYVTLENNLLRKRCYVSSHKGVIENKNYLSAIVGIEDLDFDNYTLAGQCIIANFGFVQEQSLHTDYEPVVYE